ncbi:oligopeptide ABC transporter substrate-binding protein [Vagococcus sp. BWB3-3]|uniref:Oligopeptide ABC transporter substrate-binding protein n=1 Tax=Vagococcus allomyrinae TaxID=2794353 RepID=A0A940PH56_9ENTE|nr:oligopeptide ABC transporter substrate-binding protein [Vagococcus allomyrinae]MBP1043461.1 oligopeptide ABC transporter substrate-binding protein [Vagococcus allomyrinae]
MKKKKTLGLITLTVAAALTLAACGGGSKEDGKSKENKETATEDVSKFPIVTSNTDKPIEGGDLEVAVVTDTQFKGLFLWELYQDAYDDYFMKPSHETLFTTDADFVITDDGPVKMELDQDKKQVTLTLQKDVKWSDGEALTVDDIIYSYEIIGHKDYTGIRYDDTFINVVGMDEYHDGKADTISGIKRVDDKTVTIDYKEVSPTMLQAGGGVWSYAAPKHVLKDIPVKDLESSDAVRKNPVTFGPYKMNKIVAGESVEYVPNEYYYGDKPNLDKITFNSVPAESIVEALKSKKYDMVYSMPTDTYPTYKDLKDYEILGREQMSYTYLGFKLGTWDKEANEVKMDENAKMADVSLRQAMGYAVNNDQVGEKFYNGLRSNATSLIPPVFKTFHNDKMEGYTQDKEKAKKLLADAGFKDTDDDGFVEDKDGKPLVIKFASMSGGETAQPLAEYYMQEWKDIGLNVELTTGRLIDFQAFYDKLENDDPEVDVYQGAWSTGTDPNPAGLYGRTAIFNYSRFASEENDKLLKNINSKDSFDADFRKKAFDEWQEYAHEQAFVIPTLFRNETMPISSRVTNWDWHQDQFNSWVSVGVTSEER